MVGEDEEPRDRVAAGNYKKPALCQDEVASNVDMLNEIFKHLDGASLAMASCVSKKWKQATDDEGLWEGICTRHWPSSASSQSGQLKSVVVAFGGFRRLYANRLHPLLSRNNNSYKHLKSCSMSKGGSYSSKQKWSKDEVYLSLSLFSIDRYWRIPPLHPDSARMAGIVCKPCSDEQQTASSSTAFTSDVRRLQEGWRSKCSLHPPNTIPHHSSTLKMLTTAEDPWIHNPLPLNPQSALKLFTLNSHSSRKIGDANYCRVSMDSQSSPR